MTRIRVWLSRVLDVMLRRGREERLDEEIRTHLDLLTDEYVARGMPRAEAAHAARRAFGGVDQLKVVHREQRGLPIVDAVAQDVRFALRLLRRDRGFSMTAILVLALGIGVNNMLFTILNAHTLRGLPIDRPDRVLAVSTIDDRNQDRGVSYADFSDLRDGLHTFMGLVAFTNAPVIVSGDGQAPARFEGAFISGDAFTIVGGRPVLGRAFSANDDRAGAAAVALIGSGAWQTRYGADRGILGRSVLVNGAPATVIGVVADRSGFPSTAEIWLPLSQLPGLSAQKRSDRSLVVFGRVRDGATVDDARAEILAASDRMAGDHPDTNKHVRARVVSINERYFLSWTHPAWFAFIAAGCLVVLISSANVANLMLARAVARTREIAVRTSLGASRLRIVRQLLIEGSVLAACGAVLGLGLAIAGVRLFRSAIPADALPYWLEYSTDSRVIAALVTVSAATVFVFALLPAIHSSKTDVNGVLKDEGVTIPASRGGRRWTTAFLTAEFALAVVLMAQVSLSLRVDRPPLPSERAIDTRDVLTATVTLPSERYPTPQHRSDFYRHFAERLRARPDIASVSVASAPPLMGAAERRITFAGRTRPPDAQDTVRSVSIGPRYFETLGLALVRGRSFPDEDGNQPNVLVNEELVRQFFAEVDPIGQRIAITAPNAPAAPESWVTIVGIAPDIRQRPGNDADPIVYVSYASTASVTATLLVRSRTDTSALATTLRDEAAALDSNLPLYRMRTLAQVVRDAQWNGRVARMLILTLTIIAVGLSTVGMYAVTAHAVTQQTREIGVRMALGARPRQVAQLILRRAMFQIGLGFFVGVICTILWDSRFSTGRADAILFDPRSLFTIAALMVAIAAIACLIPVRRATRLDPVQAIRRS